MDWGVAIVEGDNGVSRGEGVVWVWFVCFRGLEEAGCGRVSSD